MVCVPSASFVVSTLNEYGAEVTGEPDGAPSTSSCSEYGPTPLVGAAVTVSVPCANVQSGGSVSVTCGGPSATVNCTGAEVAELPAASVATSVSV